jgi:hypothetical protein
MALVLHGSLRPGFMTVSSQNFLTTWILIPIAFIVIAKVKGCFSTVVFGLPQL